LRILKWTAPIICSLTVLSAAAEDIPKDEAGFTDYVATQLRKEFGDHAVAIKSPLTIGVGEFQANLDRIYAFCKANASACGVEVDRYVKGAAQVARERNAPPTKEAVRLVIRSVQYVQSAQGSLPPGTSPLQPRPFVEGLVVLPALDSPRAIRMLPEKDNASLGLSSNEVYDLGISNLRKDLKPILEITKAAGNKQIGQLVGDSFYPSRLVLHDWWKPLAEAQGGTLIVALPATDAVFYIGEDTPMAIDVLRTLVQDLMRRAPNRLSNLLLRWTSTGWEVVR